MSKFGRMIVIVSLLLAALTAGCSSSAGTSEVAQGAEESAQSEPYMGKKVMLIDSYHEGYPWSDDIVTAVEEAFAGTGIEFNVIRMDTKRNSDEAFMEAAALDAKAEIEAFAPDVLIVTEDNAQKYLVVPFLMDGDIPVVFVGVNWDASVYGYPTSNVTGMVEVELVEQLIDHLGEYAEGERVSYLAVDSATERKAIDIYQERFFNEDLDVRLVSTFDEYAATFIALQDETDILFLGNNAGIDRWDEAEAQALFFENTRVPTGSVREWTAPYALISLAKVAGEQGEWAAQTVLSILDGTPISEIEMVENKRGELILNLEIAEKLEVIFPPALLKNATIYETTVAGE